MALRSTDRCSKSMRAGHTLSRSMHPEDDLQISVPSAVHFRHLVQLCRIRVGVEVNR